MRLRLASLITVLLVSLSLAAIGAILADHLYPGWDHGLPLRDIAWTVVSLLAAWLISRLIDRLAAGFHAGRYAWQRTLRKLLRLDRDERFREVDFFAGLLHLSIWLVLPLWLLQIWGLSGVSFDMLKHLAWTGFPIGQVQIVPAQIVLGALLLVAFTTIIRWLTGRLENNWLARTPLETHTREAVATLTGYVLFVIAALVVLSYAGLDLSKLALIAGALSVGIGFGLQTIVNNFVSGLILLFEQPIRRGNFISVGNTEGFVRRVRIRGTELETLERITVIVPNSQMLAGDLKNWNLRDHFGRIICRVGVAYGSDTRLVERLLLSIANGHPEVIKDDRLGVPRPQALFMTFGDSSLNFELRCFIRNITRRFIVMSEINFAIDDAFREAGVTIAFPQLDVWHRSAPPGRDVDQSDSPI